MLFTRCPDCHTNFRITADALRKADGQVKCGHCSAVFNAYQELRDDSGSGLQAPPEDNPTDVGSDSLSETDEYVALDDEAAEGSTRAEVEAGEAEVAEVEAEIPPLIEAEADDDEAGQVETDLPSPKESSLEFDLPQDEWTTFFEPDVDHHTLADNLPQGGGAIRPATDPVEPQDSEQSIDDIVIKEVVIEDVAAEDAETVPGDTQDGASRVIQAPASDETTAQLVEAASRAPEVSPETTIVLEEIDSPEDATSRSSYENDLMAIHQVDAQLQPGEKSVSHRWSVGSLLFLALLVIQAIHHFRAPLAGQPIVGPLLQAAYSVAGTEVIPDWDLSQYEIMDWVATADVGTGGPGSLQISARIHNRGPRPQPYPNVRLELKDRWEATVGSRIFTAEEYLPGDVTHERIMGAGETAPASLEVVDPGQDAYGFELDICTELSAGGLRCASDTVFQ